MASLADLASNEARVQAALVEAKPGVFAAVRSALSAQGVDVADTDEISGDFSTNKDGKGCITICVGPPFAKVCWKNCDD